MTSIYYKEIRAREAARRKKQEQKIRAELTAMTHRTQNADKRRTEITEIEVDDDLAEFFGEGNSNKIIVAETTETKGE